MGGGKGKRDNKKEYEQFSDESATERRREKEGEEADERERRTQVDQETLGN